MIVRKGIAGYSKTEEAARKTLLHEGIAVRTRVRLYGVMGARGSRLLCSLSLECQLAKLLVLVFVVYTYYLASFISDDNHVRLVLSIGFFGAIGLSMLPLVRACHLRSSHSLRYSLTCLTSSSGTSWAPTTCS